MSDHIITLLTSAAVRLANLMKVLTSDAVQDPTRVEARVRREVAMRKHTHEKMNVERKLTDEQRREKIENKKLDEEKKGICGAVFKYVYRSISSRSQLMSFVDVGSRTFRILRIDSRFGRTPNR
jgi:hypothetical protein